MKLKFKNQPFQAAAAQAVCDVFEGQPYRAPGAYLMDRGHNDQTALRMDEVFTGFSNALITPELNEAALLENLQRVQRNNALKPDEELKGNFNLTVEMETGVGKTYTYIKTMFELNKRYGWSKFIVVVPSVAIREGVNKSFQITEDHFLEAYGKKIRYFIYNSKSLNEIDRFASDSAINVMIINSQAFNAQGKDARRIRMELDEFRSRRPIDILAATHPILIIDEPQSVEGKKTIEGLKDFKPLMTLRYSATHRPDRVFNMVYRLDALDAYNKKLVKKIAVKGVSETSSTGTGGYVYLQSINVESSGNPTATIEFELRGSNSIRKITRKVGLGFDLYQHSDGLDEYSDHYVISRIDARDTENYVEFLNGIKLYPGDVVGSVNEELLRRIQIREAILSHIERERHLFPKGIKVLSLFFIDEVAKYKRYDENGIAQNGDYAEVFEEEYRQIVENRQTAIDEVSGYGDYLDGIDAAATHAGYFSIDKKSNQMVNSKVKRSETSADDPDAYDLIMKDKERLLSFEEPVRFIFSHSALREGWDNPNVFQICTLKSSGSEVRKRQEVGRGLRLAVDQNGDRMDEELLGADVHNINVLTVVASESYEDFTRALQSEMAEAVAGRPQKVSARLFEGKVLHKEDGSDVTVSQEMAQQIYDQLLIGGYIDTATHLPSERYQEEKQGDLDLPAELVDLQQGIVELMDSVYDPSLLQPENARAYNVEPKADTEKLHSAEFKALWSRINRKSFYTVSFDENELIRRAVEVLNQKLEVDHISVIVTEGQQQASIDDQRQLSEGVAFTTARISSHIVDAYANTNVKYDLVGKLVEGTGLTRKAIVKILTGLDIVKFDMFAYNPESFIMHATRLIKEQQATLIIEHITYNKLETTYDSNIFTEPTLKGKLGTNAVEVQHSLYDYLIYDSTNEKKFAEKLDASEEVAIYVKLPSGFFIDTPVGKYNPDWAIAFNEGTVRHVYFIAETKGSMESLQLKGIEEAKIHCAREHFKAISGDKVIYDVVDSYEALMNKVMA